MTSYARCPYAFYLLDSGKISPEDAYPQFILDRMAAGVTFEDAILDDLPVLPERLLPESLGARYLFGIDVQEHRELKLFGQPDGIEIETHAPIEIKHHQRLTALDALELAFYWTLLEPQRRSKTIAPHGWIQLRAPDGSARELEYVELLPSHFHKVDELILKVREARKYGVEPDVCHCFVCKSRDEVAQCIDDGQSVRLIFGVDRKYATVLEKMNIDSITALASVEDPVLLADQMRRRGSSSISPLHVAQWHHHALAYVEDRPVRFQDERFAETNYIILDLEWAADVFLIGVLVRLDGQDQVFQLWCDTDRERRAALKEVIALLASHPELSIVTYKGTTADVPQLRAIGEEFGLDIESLLTNGHVDMYQRVQRTVRFPVYKHGVKAIARYLGHNRQSSVSGGEEIPSLYDDYRSARKLSTRQRIKADIFEYNREDLEACAVLVEFLRTLELHPDASAFHSAVVAICDERKREAKRQEKRRYRERRAGKLKEPALTRKRELEEIDKLLKERS